jgi:hypothetical protein
MRPRNAPARLAAVVMLAAALGMAGSMPAGANWLSRLARGAGEAGEAGVKAGKLGLGALDSAASLVAKLPPPAKGVALAAHATPEGHWKFVNREGEVFTAGNADELSRVTSTLAPELSADGKLALYLSEDTVFRERALMKDLPDGADLHLVVGDDSYRLARRTQDGAEKLVAEVRPNITVEIGDRKLFEEAVFQLGRSLNRSNIRVLALEPGGPKALASVPRFDPATKTALVDQIDPGALGQALGKIRGQTVLVTGRVEGDVLIFRPAGGPEQKLFVHEMLRAAEAADVNLVVLKAAQPRQPGGRNWLWQKVEVAGLDEAMQRTTFADFLNALGASGGELTVTAAQGSPGRIVLSATPTGKTAAPLTDTVGDWIGEFTGNVAVQAVQVFARDAERERELDARFIPGIPSLVQIAYLFGLVQGIIGIAVARRWWARIWPPEERQEYRGALGYRAAQTARLVALVLIFLPIAGPPAFFWTIVLQLWSFITAPLRFFGWMRARLSPGAG